MSPATLRTGPVVSTAAADEELLDRVRAGQVDAYGELWRRHVRVALAVAGRYSTVADPEDIVQEAFQSVFTAVCDGGGPTRGFRPYLTKTVRNVAVSISRRRRADPVGGLTELAETIDVPEPGHADQSVDRMVLVRAFQALPERWRAILWMTVVEDLPVQDAAGRLGIAPNAGAALARRAREGLRRAWLAAHVRDRDLSPECRWVVEHLPLAGRGDASEKHLRRVDAHTASCDDCARAALEIAVLARRLPALLVPIALTGGAAAEHLLAGVPAASPADVGSVGVAGPGLVPAGDVTGSTAPGRALLGRSSTAPSLPVGLRVAAAVAVVVMTAAAVVAVGAHLGRSTSAAPAGAVTDSDGPVRTRAMLTTTDDPGAEPGDEPAARQTDSSAPAATSQPPEPSEPGSVSSPPEGTVAPGPSVEVTSPADAGEPPTVTSGPVSGLQEWVPVISGTGTSGSTVEAVLADGSLIGSGLVTHGAWTIEPDAALAADVEHAVAVRYEGDERLVDVGRFTVVAPLVTGVEVGESRPGVHDVVVLVTGTCGQAVEASVVGTDRTASVVLGSCTTRVPLPAVTPGTHSVELRYVDPVRGRAGAVRTISVTV